MSNRFLNNILNLIVEYDEDENEEEIQEIQELNNSEFSEFNEFGSSRNRTSYHEFFLDYLLLLLMGQYQLNGETNYYINKIINQLIFSLNSHLRFLDLNVKDNYLKFTMIDLVIKSYLFSIIILYYIPLLNFQIVVIFLFCDCLPLVIIILFLILFYQFKFEAYDHIIKFID